MVNHLILMISLFLIDSHLGMRKPIGGTTERYRVKDFQRDEIDQRLKYVVSFYFVSVESIDHLLFFFIVIH